MSDAIATGDEADAGSAGTGPLTDFKDWLSPMLVKELRQGMRTRTFVMAFILLQAAMLVVMLAAAGSRSPGRSTESLWFVTGIALLVAMPLRGFAALSNEMRMRTMDLLTLTRLSAFRITFGKWAALFSQSLLLAVALLPYVVIRYFLGGIDIAAELVVLGMLTIGSGVLTALTVGFSAHQSILLRGAVVVLAAFMVGGFLSSLEVFRFRGVSVVALDGFWWVALGVVAFAVFVIYYLLDMGASQFAPFAENHSTRKRLVGLLFVGAVFALGLLHDESWFAVTLFVVMVAAMAIVCVDALTDHPAPVPSVYMPFVRRGLAGRLFGKLFYPGWHTGLLYFAVIVALVFLFEQWFSIGALNNEDERAIAVAMLGTVLFPVLLIRLFFRGHPAPFALYLLIQCITVPLVLLLMEIDDGEGLLWIACPVPFVQFCLIENYKYDDPGLPLPFAFTIIYFAVLFTLSLFEHRKGAELEAIAAATLRAEGEVGKAEESGTRTGGSS